MSAGQGAREQGLIIGPYQPGEHNAITDVPGVRVGHTTVRREPDLHTGVTAIVPDALPLNAGLFAGNGYGKLVGATQLAELGLVETPIVLTATLSAFRAADALLTWMLERDPALRSLNPVVGECNDGWLSDIRARPITPAHVFAALDGATTGPVAQGCVGAGTGTTALGFKAGIGTSSRTFPLAGATRPVTVGALVQANFGGTLRLPAPQRQARTATPTRAAPPRDGEVVGGGASDGLLGAALAGGGAVGGGALYGGRPVEGGGDVPPEDGSCMIVVATDARLDARQLARVARRAVFALARVGAAYSHGSGDYAIAFSTATDGPPMPDQALSPLFAATLDVVEESVLNSLLAAVTTTGFEGHVAEALRLP